MTTHTEDSTSSTNTADNTTTIQEQLRRRAAELTLARPFVETVLQHGRRLVEERRQARQQNRLLDESAFLTDDERSVLRKQGYYGRAQGLLAGALVFGITFGGFRWSAWRKTLRKTTGSSSSSSSSYLPPRPSQRFAELDRTSQQQSNKKNNRRRSGASSSSSDAIIQEQRQQLSLNIMSDDVMMQLQFMFAGGLGLVVASVVANRTADQARYFRDLAALPLKPGKSRLCHAMCPALVQQMQELRAQQAMQQQNWSIQTLLDDPMTPELESITHLVQNCQERINYQESLLRNQQQQQSLEQRNDNDEIVVTIPEPGVPIHYLQVDDDGSENKDDGSTPTA